MIRVTRQVKSESEVLRETEKFSCGWTGCWSNHLWSLSREVLYFPQQSFKYKFSSRRREWVDHIVWVVLDGNWKFKFGEEGLKRMLLPFIFLPLTISSLLERDSEVSGALPNQWRALPEPTIPTKHTPVTVILRIWKVKVESEIETGWWKLKVESGKWKWHCQNPLLEQRMRQEKKDKKGIWKHLKTAGHKLFSCEHPILVCIQSGVNRKESKRFGADPSQWFLQLQEEWWKCEKELSLSHSFHLLNAISTVSLSSLAVISMWGLPPIQERAARQKAKDWKFQPLSSKFNR